MDFRGVFRARSYTEQAREVIRHLIFSGNYKPGEHLKEAKISQTLGISRSPVREAIYGLASEGLVRLVPQKGAFVSTFDVAEVRALFGVSEALESLAARLAAEKADRGQLGELLECLKATEDALDAAPSALYPRDLDFHQRVCRLAGNEKLLDHVSQIHTQLHLARSRSSSRPGRARQAYEEHLAIYKALKERDPNKADEAMRHHLRNGLKSTLEILADQHAGVA